MKKQLKRFKKKAHKTTESIKAKLANLKHYCHVLYSLCYQVACVLALMGLTVVISQAVTEIRKDYLEHKVSPNVVFIRSPEGAKLQGSGTAFEVKAPSGKVYTVTNAHVCELQKDGFVMLLDKRVSHRLVPKRIIEVYQDNDLCLVEGLEGYEGLSVADSIYAGEAAWSVGFPLAQDLNIASGRVKGFNKVDILMEGTPPSACTGKDERVETINIWFFQVQVCVIRRSAVSTDVATYPGSSGSPLLNSSGDVIGVVFASDNTAHWGSAVPLSFLKDLLKPY